MFKNRSRICLALGLLLIGTWSSVFAVDFSQALDHMKEDVFSMWTLFKGKSTVSNLYSKALKLTKDREVSATTTSLDQLKDYYSDCNGVKNSDFVNVLYNTNTTFRTIFEQLLDKKTKRPTTEEIQKSYTKLLACKGITVAPTNADITSINDEVQNVYYQGYTNAYTMSTLNQDNFWSDLLWNGTLDDSDFDLLADIDQVGKIFFEDFKDSPEILFYRLPAVQQSSTQNGSNLSSLSDQSSSQVWGGGSSFSPTNTSSASSSSSAGSSSASPVSAGVTSQAITVNKNIPSLADDKDVQTFIEHTNAPTASTPAGAALLFWNQCLSWDTSIPISEEQSEELMTPEAYISGIEAFISTANIDDVVNQTLLAEFTKNNPLAAWTNTSAAGYADAVANTYAEQSFGEAAQGTCEYSCKDLPLDKQAQCELGCSKSCIQSCDGLVLQDKLLCVSDCTCFLLAGPNGAGREKIEDMFRIKFCKVPVQKTTVVKRTKAFSIQAIFQEISDVLEWLKNSGQMVKFSKTKEFLDGNVKIKLADNFAFSLQVGFKPVFAQKSTTTKLKEQQQDLRDFSLWIMGMNISNPTADDYNKYVVISDPVKNKASLESASSLDEINQNIENFTLATQSAANNIIATTTLADLTKTYTNKTNIVLVQNMISFLQDNQSFWNGLSETLLDMTKMSLELKAKIESSK